MGRKRAIAEESEQISGSQEAVSEPVASVDSSKPKRHVSPAEFFQLCANYGDKAATCFYIYRLWPVINRSLAGIKNSYIEKAVTLDASTLLRSHGSGKYQVRFTDSNRPRGMTEVYRTFVEFNEPDQPAVLDVRELDRGHRDNQSYIQGLVNRGLMPKEGEEMAGDGVKEVVGLARDMMQKMTDKPGKPEGSDLDRALQIMQALKPNADPMELALKIAEMSRKDDGSNSMVKGLMDSQKELVALLIKAREPAPAAENPFGPVDSVLGLLDKLGVKIGGRSSISETSWVDRLPEMLNAGATLLQSFAMLRAGSAAAVPSPAAAVPATVETRVPEIVSAVPENGGSVLNPMRLAAVGQKAVLAFQRGMSGDAFAEALVSLEDDGEQVYRVLYTLGSANILGMIKGLPVWSQLAEHEAKISTFIADFLSYGAPEEDGKEPQS